MASRLKTLQGETNPILSKFAVGYKDEQFIAKKVCPVVTSFTESGTLFTFGKEGFYLYDTERALRANAKKISFAVSKDTYRCVEKALETSLDYKELETAQKYGAAQVLKLEKRATMLTQRSLERELEKAVADLVLSATYYASGNKITLTGDDKWSSANSDPLGQIRTGIKAARADMGIKPNALTLGFDAYWALASHAQIKAMVSDAKDKEHVLDASDLAKLLKLKYVFVGEAVYSTDAGVFTDIWPDNAALHYLPDNPELVEGTTPHSIIIEEIGYPEVRTYAEKKVKSYETTRKYTTKNVGTSYGYLFVDCN